VAGCPRRGVSAHDGEDVAAHERDGGGLQRPGHGDKLLRRQLPGGGAFRLMCHLHSSIGSTRGWTRYKRCRGISGRDGARRYAVASARELDGALGGNGDGGGFRFHGASDARERERANESEWEGRRTRPPCGRQWAVAPGRPRRMAATRQQRPVAGRPLCRSEFPIQCSSVLTDKASSSLHIS